MLGQMVKQVLSSSKQLTVEYTCRRQSMESFRFDVEDRLDGLRPILEQYGHFNYVINCVGILSNNINPRDAQSIRQAILVNALFPHDLAILAQETGARVIHISTDGVFARNAGVCLEDSPLSCDDIYGKTKSLGEVIAPKFLNLRCSIIGPNLLKKQGLLEWFRGQLPGAEVSGYTDHLWNGVTTLQFAELCGQLILQDLFDVVRSEGPIHHFCPNQTVSKYELLQLFRTVFRPDVTVKPISGQGTPAHRILDTRYTSLKERLGNGQPMQRAIERLTTEN